MKTPEIKQSMLARMFPADGSTTPEIRFQGFSEPWHEVKLGECLQVSIEKNRSLQFGVNDVLSVSGEQGIVNQIDFKGRSFAGADLSNYNIVRVGDVVYTKSPLKSCPYGIVKTNCYREGIVSALYGVYKATENNDPYFFQVYFLENNRLNNYLRPLISKGAKNTLIISDSGALNGIVSVPTLAEQRLIGTYFRSLDTAIRQSELRAEALRRVRASMLARMFPNNQ